MEPTGRISIYLLIILSMLAGAGLLSIVQQARVFDQDLSADEIEQAFGIAPDTTRK